MRSASSSSERPCRICSFESGGDRDRVCEAKRVPVRGKLLGERAAIGRMHEVKNADMDLVRK